MRTALSRRESSRVAVVVICLALSWLAKPAAGGEGSGAGPCPQDAQDESLLRTQESLRNVGVTLSGRGRAGVLADRAVDVVDTPDFRLLLATVETFASADEALRMVVQPTAIERVRKGDDHVAVAFRHPVPLQAGVGRQPICLLNLVVPLSGTWAEKRWVVFYRDVARGWFALTWSELPAAARDGLRRTLEAAISPQGRAQKSSSIG